MTKRFKAVLMNPDPYTGWQKASVEEIGLSVEVPPGTDLREITDRLHAEIRPRLGPGIDYSLELTLQP